MTEPAKTTHFEAKKHAFRQTQDGVVISFVLHPNDISPELAAAPLGTQYVVALAPYVEAAEVVPIARARKRPETEGEKAVQRCGILCRDTQFQLWMSSRYPGRTGTIDDAVRVYCGVQSRAHIATNPIALALFYELENLFREWAAGR